MEETQEGNKDKQPNENKPCWRLKGNWKHVRHFKLKNLHIKLCEQLYLYLLFNQIATSVDLRSKKLDEISRGCSGHEPPRREWWAFDSNPLLRYAICWCGVWDFSQRSKRPGCKSKCQNGHLSFPLLSWHLNFTIAKAASRGEHRVGNVPSFKFKNLNSFTFIGVY